MTEHTSEEIKNRLSNIGEAIGPIALEYIVELEKENVQLKQQLENEKQLNAEIKKRLVEVEYDCEEFNHEYCDVNCNGKRKELVDLYQLISDGLNETLLKQKDTEIEQLKSELQSYQILAHKRGESYLASLKDEENLQKENEQLKLQFEKLLDFVADRVEECDVCELTDTCINSEGVCPFARSNRNIKDLIKKHITNK